MRPSQLLGLLMGLVVNLRLRRLVINSYSPNIIKGLITYAKVMISSAFVHFLVSRITQKLMNPIFTKLGGKEHIGHDRSRQILVVILTKLYKGSMSWMRTSDIPPHDSGYVTMHGDC